MGEDDMRRGGLPQVISPGYKDEAVGVGGSGDLPQVGWVDTEVCELGRRGVGAQGTRFLFTCLWGRALCCGRPELPSLPAL